MAKLVRLIAPLLLCLFLGGLFLGGLAAAQEAGSLTGKLLIARPDLDDPNFSRTVIVMLEQGPGGALGLIVNRPLGEASIAEVLENTGQPFEGLSGSLPAYLGGPVEPGRLFLLHSDDWRLPNSRAVGPGLALSDPAAALPVLGKGEGPERALLLFGYSGWGPGQLEAEMERGSWEVQPLDAELVLDRPDSGKWDQAIEGVEVEL